MALTAMTLRDGSFSVASMAMGKLISSPALASILSGEESAISGAVEPCSGCAKPVELLGVLAALRPPEGGIAPSPRGRIVPCHNRTRRIAVGTSATLTKAEIRPFRGRPGLLVAEGVALVSSTGKPASSFCSLCGSGAKRSASVAMVRFEMAERLIASTVSLCAEGEMPVDLP